MRRRSLYISALALSAALLASALAPVPAGAKEKSLERGKVIVRAKRWAKAKVPYSQVRHSGPYRTDCSGLVSMAWELPENLTTWRIPLVAKRISKSQIRKGDVLLNSTGPGRHVVLFEKWAKRDKSAYWGIEQTGQRGVNRTIRRVLPYPYRVQKHLYKPYRYVGMSNYYAHIGPKDRQPVRGYRGRVQVAKVMATANAKRRAKAVRKASPVPRRPQRGARVEPTARDTGDDRRQTAVRRQERDDTTQTPQYGQPRTEQRTQQASGGPERGERMNFVRRLILTLFGGLGS